MGPNTAHLVDGVAHFGRGGAGAVAAGVECYFPRLLGKCEATEGNQK
jgi:hypothetical protein